MTTALPEPANVNARTVQLVKLLAEVGPDVPEISRRLGQFKESVRYRYKEKILNKGFAVQANVDHERLGLRRVIVVLDFAEEYRRFSQSILASMNELCFLVSFSKTMPGGYYIANFSAPREFVDQLKSFLGVMKEKGMFSRLDIVDFDWIRIVPMKSEFYDFDTGRWDFDWTAKTMSDFTSAQYMPSSPAKFDYTDLLLIKELQMDANKSLKEISDKLKVNYKKLAWHYTTHVMARRLLSGYRVNWMGTSYDYAIEKALHRQHRYFAVTLMVRGVTEYETMSLRQAVDRLPFLWSEAVGANYFCEFAFPVDFVVEGLQYLTETISAVKERTEIYVVDQSDAAGFTISYSRYNQARKKWEFNLADLISRFEALIVEIKKETT
jgi:DNA-binding Lrp family transcriptional regulator